jgi:hypothetical protein
VHTRPATAQDWKKIEEMHARANYGFQLPAPETISGVHLVVEDDVILAAAGYEPAAQIFAVLNPEISSPFRRLAALKALHGPLAAEVLSHDIRSVFSFCDPRYRNTEKRLMRLGWNKKMWPCVFLERGEIQKVFG